MASLVEKLRRLSEHCNRPGRRPEGWIASTPEGAIEQLEPSLHPGPITGEYETAWVSQRGNAYRRTHTSAGAQDGPGLPAPPQEAPARAHLCGRVVTNCPLVSAPRGGRTAGQPPTIEADRRATPALILRENAEF